MKTKYIVTNDLMAVVEGDHGGTKLELHSKCNRPIATFDTTDEAQVQLDHWKDSCIGLNITPIEADE